jgi:hypothetical protein
MTTWPASHGGLRALSGFETTCVLKLDQRPFVYPVAVSLSQSEPALLFWM